jgi:glyoxylase-like metal-dependent hydrolase (beta-lactamase superfamily II)
MWMRRSFCMAILAVVGILLTASTHEAHQQRAALELHDVAENLYMLSNASSVDGMGGGGNTAIFVTGSGVVLVDTKINGYGRDILSEVERITDQPVTTIINTHNHYDHSGGNVEFSDTVNFVVHENARAQMARANCEPVTNCDAFKGVNEKYLPETTYSDQLSLFSGSDQIDLYHFGRGHTDGDTFVVFRALGAMHTGDMFARKGLPFIDAVNGNGSATDFGSTLQKAVEGIRNVEMVIPGHATAVHTWSDLVDSSGFYNDVVTKAQRAKAAGQSVEEFIRSYRAPSEYSDFEVEERRLTSIAGYLFDGQ